MKSRLFWFSLIGLCFAIGVILAYQHYDKVSEAGVLRVAFPSHEPALSYDPTRIHLDFQYILLENIYSPLVEFDRDGILQPGVTQSAEWHGDQLVLAIRKGLKTENGTPITAEDAAFSLKRLLVLSGNTHGNFEDLVCDGKKLKSINDSCPGIRVEGDKLILTSKKGRSFLLPMMAAIDFAIIPKSSVDPVTLKITNMKETSGPYYVAQDLGDGKIELKLNPFHYHASKDVPQVVKLVPIVSADASLEALLSNEIDHITTIGPARSDKVLPFAKKHRDFNLFVTHKIREITLTFTGKGQEHFSVPERRYLAEKIREAYQRIYASVPDMEPSLEFIPSLGDGSLNPTQLAELKKSQDQAQEPKRPVRIGLLVRKATYDKWADAISSVLPGAHLSLQTDVPDFEKNQADVPDAFIGTTDTAFSEDIGFISYSLNAGYFGLSKDERKAWLARYMSIEDKSERLDMLRKLHFNALLNDVTVPLLAAPYTAVVRKPWKMDLSPLYADDQFWRIKHP